ncbi:hypothetical protein Taro_040745 [Colocasia esculenta]|uniref:Uncharacterized protein n=1 Tax=Colocasia esculenta TaxID=4460 RepID=A0A843WMS5_COLES|nr:hypothetical protein [Colocasia esculenta]
MDRWSRGEEVLGSWEEARGSSELGGETSQQFPPRRSEETGPQYLASLVAVFPPVCTSPSEYAPKGRVIPFPFCTYRSVSPSGSPDPWAAVPTVGSLVGAGDPGAGAVT